MTEAARHTPGPWAIEEVHDDFEIYPVYDAPPKFGRWSEVATVSGIYEGEAAHNAHLIAASPEMFDVLTDFVMIYGMNNAEPAELRAALGKIVDRASAAVRKATGRGE